MQKILVVDDDSDLAEMVQFVLTSAGLSGVCAWSEDDMFQKLANEKFDLILMDIFLGDADGRLLCSQVKGSGEYCGIPVILYSAGANVSPESIRESRADGFIAKPFDTNLLLEKIRQLLQEQQRFSAKN